MPVTAQLPKRFRTPIRWAVALILGFLLVLLTDIVRLRSAVPVGLPPFEFWVRGDSAAGAQGTWVPEEAGAGVPIQTTRLACYRQEHRCIELTAAVGYGNQLATAVAFHPIDSWSGDAITTSPEPQRCVNRTIRIDLAARTAVAQETPRSDAPSGCDPEQMRQRTIRLADGLQSAMAQERSMFLPALTALRVLGI